MKQVILVLVIFLIYTEVRAQVKEGRLIYERTQQLQIQLSGEDQAMQNMIPKERKDRFELLFANNQAVWQSTGEEGDNGDMVWNNGGAQIRMIVPGSNDIIYNDFNRQLKVEQREVMTKTFVIQDSIRRMDWKLGAETKTILGHTCRKATTKRIQQNYRVNMDNGEMKRVQVTDTLQVVAWFTDAFALPGGPEQYQGQLPGTILELDVNNGRTRFVAQEFTPKIDVREIKEPKGKKITPEEFAKEREKMFKEMEKNSGGNFNIRTGN
jgi:GLPGLI family protein